MSGILTDGIAGPPKTREDHIANALAVDPLHITVNTKEYQTGYGANDRGLKYQIEGRATRIEVNVGNALATYSDPIKALFGTRICEGQKVQVVRKYVVGGKAVATPERAPARIVKVKEDAREVELVRYGADLTMNLNLMLRPADAREELNMKVDAQKKSLENELTRFGYEQALQGLKLGPAIARSKGYKPDGNNYIACVNDVHKDMFAAFQRYETPLTSLIALAKTATAYRNVVGRDSVMILPGSSPEMLEYAKYMKLFYKVNGVKSTDKKPLTVNVDDVYDDPTIGLKLMVHHPPQDHQVGQNMPIRGESPLFRKFVIIDEVKNGCHYMDMKTREVSKDAATADGMRFTTVIMGSALIGVPGANTGELLIGYPFTATSTNQRTESMTVSLRVYLGAVLKQQENVLVLPNVYLDQVEDCKFYTTADIGNFNDALKRKYAIEKQLPTHGKPTTAAGYKVVNGKFVMQHHSTSYFAEMDSIEGVDMARGHAVFKPKCKLVKQCEASQPPPSGAIDLTAVTTKIGTVISDMSKVSTEIGKIETFLKDKGLDKSTLHSMLQQMAAKRDLTEAHALGRLQNFMSVLSSEHTAASMTKAPVVTASKMSMSPGEAAAAQELEPAKGRRGGKK